MRISKLVAWTALVSGLAAIAPTPASAQIGGLIKKKVQGAVAQATGTNPTTVSPAAQATPGPVFSTNVLEITPALLDQLEKALAAEAATRASYASRLGNGLTKADYDLCKQDALMSPAGQKLSADFSQQIGQATTQAEIDHLMQDMATRLEAFLEPICGLEPNKAELLRQELALRLAATGAQAAGLTNIQLSILKERILPLCTATGAVNTGTGQLRIPTASSTIFWVYSPTEFQALQPRCGTLLQALQAGT